MTSLHEWFRDSKFGGTFTRKKGLVPSRRPLQKRYQLDTCYLLNSNEHTFIYLVLIKNDMNNLLRTSRLFGQQSSSVGNGFKVTPI